MTTILLLIAAALWYQRARHRRRHPTTLRRSSRRHRALVAVALVLGFQMALGMPATAAQDCGQAPNPERPTTGMVAALDAPRPSHGQPGSVYGTYGYAGQVWHTYDDKCGAFASLGPKSSIDTWAGNQLFNIAKNLVAATNGLHYAIAYDELTNPLDTTINAASRFFYSNTYTQLISLALLILAVLMFRYIWRGDLATLSRHALWALAALWTASSFLTVGPVYKELEEHFLAKVTDIQGGFLADNAPEADLHALPQALHERVVYTNWLRGEFGSDTAPEATQYGPELLDAQAWKKLDTTDTVGQSTLDAKKEKYKEIAGKLGATKGYFTGQDGSRTGAGILALLQSILYSLFQLLAKLAILLAQILLRIFILATPLIGLIAILHNELLRRVATAAAAVIINVLVLAALAGMHLLLLNAIFNAKDSLPTIATMALAAITTAVFLIIARPLRRVFQMARAAGTAGKPGSATEPDWRDKLQAITPADEQESTNRQRPRPETQLHPAADDRNAHATAYATTVVGLITTNAPPNFYIPSQDSPEKVPVPATEGGPPATRTGRDGGDPPSTVDSGRTGPARQPRVADVTFEPRDTQRDKHGSLIYQRPEAERERDGGKPAVYRIPPEANRDHQGDSVPSNRSSYYDWVDADQITMDAAQYADDQNLWTSDNPESPRGAFKRKAKVKFDVPVGRHHKTGQLTDTVNVYRRRSGTVHSSPGSNL